jgi:hypothetical protein
MRAFGTKISGSLPLVASLSDFFCVAAFCAAETCERGVGKKAPETLRSPVFGRTTSLLLLKHSDAVLRQIDGVDPRGTFTDQVDHGSR